MIDAADLLRAIAEARSNPENIPLPDYTFDVHTAKGRARGKTKSHVIIGTVRHCSFRELGYV